MSDRVVTRNDQGRTITVQTGDAIVLWIEENLSTGYSWDIAAESRPVLALQHSEHVAATGGLMGCNGMRLLHFVAQVPGSQPIRLQLRRPWDPPNQAIDQFSVTVVVN